MMNATRLVQYVTAEPFHPFRVKMTSGETFEIRHSEMAFVGVRTARVFTSSGENGEHQNREVEISILLIESIEILTPSSQESTENRDTE